MIDEKTLAKRRERLRKGYCPACTYRASFSSVSDVPPNLANSGRSRFLARCPNKGCKTLAWTGYDDDSVSELLPEWQFLVDPNVAETAEVERLALWETVIEAGKRLDRRSMETPNNWACETLKDFLSSADGKFRTTRRSRARNTGESKES